MIKRDFLMKEEKVIYNYNNKSIRNYISFNLTKLMLCNEIVSCFILK